MPKKLSEQKPKPENLAETLFLLEKNISEKTAKNGLPPELLNIFRGLSWEAGIYPDLLDSVVSEASGDSGEWDFHKPFHVFWNNTEQEDRGAACFATKSEVMQFIKNTSLKLSFPPEQKRMSEPHKFIYRFTKKSSVYYIVYRNPLSALGNKA